MTSSDFSRHYNEMCELTRYLVGIHSDFDFYATAQRKDRSRFDKLGELAVVSKPYAHAGEMSLSDLIFDFNIGARAVADKSLKLKVEDLKTKDGNDGVVAVVKFKDNVSQATRFFLPTLEWAAAKIKASLKDLHCEKKEGNCFVTDYAHRELVIGIMDEPDYHRDPRVDFYHGDVVLDSFKDGLSYVLTHNVYNPKKADEEIADELRRFKDYIIDQVKSPKSPILGDIVDSLTKIVGRIDKERERVDRHKESETAKRKLGKIGGLEI